MRAHRSSSLHLSCQLDRSDVINCWRVDVSTKHVNQVSAGRIYHLPWKFDIVDALQNVYLKIQHYSCDTSIPIPFKFLFKDLMLSNIIRDLNSSSTSGIEPFDLSPESLPPELAFHAAGYIIVGTLAVSYWCLLPIWISWLTVDSDVHLGNFNQHRQRLQSPLRASVTLTHRYLFYIAVSSLFSIAVFQLIRLLSKVMLFCVYYICYGNASRMWAQNFQCYFINKPLIFFSNTFEFNVCHAWKTDDLFLLCRSRIHVSPFLLPHSSRI